MIAIYVILLPFILACTLWSAGALYFDAGRRSGWGGFLACVWILAILAVFYFITPIGYALLIFGGLFGLLLAWWFSQRPTNDRDWDPNFAKLAELSIEGDEVTITNIRHTRYRSLEDYDCQWETRVLRLSDLKSADVMILYWGSDAMCHPSITFDFGNGDLINISIEVRCSKNESFGVLKGFYRQNELMYVVSDERDAILRRTKYDTGNDIYLYRIQNSPAAIRTLFDEFMRETNRLVHHPRWYHTITANCTTSIFWQRRGEVPWDWRMLFNGKFDELLYEWERLYQGLPFSELRKRSHINEVANQADYDRFSQSIRKNLPGY